jgi:hypothetical protein
LTVREARLLDLAGDLILVRVDYEPSGSDVFPVIPTPEPSAVARAAAALTTVACLCRRRRR